MIQVPYDPALTHAPSWCYLDVFQQTRRLMRCPNGHAWTLGLNYDVNDEGYVTPSVECPEPGCTFHDMVRLLTSSRTW